MAHRRTQSVESISSNEALESFTDSHFQKSITGNVLSEQSHEELVAGAKEIIENFQNHEKKTYSYKEKTIELDQVLAAMLIHADEAGGEKSKRYVASTIVACVDHNEVTDFEKLVAVAVTWLTHLLYICM